jgi:hypothetical protein
MVPCSDQGPVQLFSFIEIVPYEEAETSASRTAKICILLCVSTVRIKVSHHNKIKQDRHYCICIRFIISLLFATCFDSY